MSLTCPQCGEQNRDDAKICGMCGIVLTRSPVATQASPVPPQVRQTMPPPPVSGYGYGPMQQQYVVYAGFWLRFIASFIDGLILASVGFVIGILLSLAGAGSENTGQLVGIAIGWLYNALLESSSAQGSLGKMALGLKVTDMDGYPISFGRATGRHFAKIISAIILLIGFIIAGFTAKKQALHDLIAGCLVVKK